MTIAQLHDGTSLEVTTFGAGPAVLLPERTALVEGEAAEQARAWGADPDAGHTLATALAAAGLRVVAADYTAHRAAHPQPHTLTADAVAADVLAIADAAGADRFTYYGYSWLALAGFQLALRTDRLDGLAMGGYPPLGGPYAAMLAVTRSAHRMAVDQQANPPAPGEAEPGDWGSAPIATNPDQTRQYVTLYESLAGFDERAALDRLGALPRLAFAGADDTIVYGAQWDNARVVIGDALLANSAELTDRGWTVHVLPGADHMRAMHADLVVDVLLPWLRANAIATPPAHA